MKQKIRKINKASYGSQGFVILFAMLISSIILLISSGIFNIVKKQVVLSSYARESQKAFYAADAALDCALFNDISPLIASSSFSVITPADTQIECGGGTISVDYLDSTGGTNNGEFDFPFVFRYYGLQNLANNDYVGSGCAYVLVEKEGISGSSFNTRITASGFNTCMSTTPAGHLDTPDFDNPKLLERRISIRYTTSVTQ